MADSSFRTFRRDGLARDNEPTQRENFADPLAELARLIGQSEAHGDAASDQRQPEGFEEGAPGELEWAAADEEYVQHSDDPDARYAPPAAEPPYAQPSYEAAWPRQHGFEEEGPGTRQYERPAPAYQNGNADPGRDAGQEDTYYRDGVRPAASRTEPPLYAPPIQGGYQADQQQRYGAQASGYPDDAPDYDRDPYDDEAPPTRRSGTVVIVALLGLAVLGTAGAMGYRAMFGGSMIPSLPPIIRPSDTPIKILPKRDAQTGMPGQTGAGATGTGERVVTHEEPPVDVQSANPVPRVVTTIPVISSTPNAPLPGTQPSAVSEQTAGAPMASVAPPAFAEPSTATPPPGVPDQLAAPSPGSPSGGSRAVQTIKIRPGQQAAANPPDATAQPEARSPKPRQPVARPVREAAPRQTPGGPLSIVPTQETARPAPAPARMAMTRPTGPTALGSPSAEAAPAAGGGYAVQVTSQRSEAEAQAAFRALQAKYPRELGGHRAVYRRADLGAKGVYYRALVGPFGSAEQAASLCSSLKAAGGNCLIQRN